MATGHILIATPRGTWIEPATFFPNGLAVHRRIGERYRSDPPRYSVTHVRSGLQLRGMLTRKLAFGLAHAVCGHDWTFDASAATERHAEIVREAL